MIWLQNIQKYMLIKVDENQPLKTPMFPLQLSKSWNLTHKSTPISPYNCRFVWILGVLLILIADTFDENIATLKAPINPPNCQMCVILVHFRAIKHLPLAPQLSIYVNLIAK